MRKMIVVLICMLLFLSGCGNSERENEEPQTYTIPGNVYFDDDYSERERLFTAKQIKTGQSGLEKSVEDAYLNEDGDLVMVMTLNQCKEMRESLAIFLYMCITSFEGDLLSYSYNDMYTELYMKFTSKEVYSSDINQSRINNILSMMLMQQIYGDIDAVDATVTLDVEYADTGDTGIIVYKCEGFVK